MPDTAPATAVAGYAMDEIIRRASEARRLSNQIVAQANRTAARPVWDFNHVIAYGQSLSSGWEGWPALSVTQRHDSLMLGDSVHGLNESGSRFEVAGKAQFRPLVATVMSNAPRGEVLTPEAVSALPVGNPALGETVLEGALNFWRGRQLALGAERFPGRLVATSTGVGGRSIEQLSVGQGAFNRPRQAVELAKQLASQEAGSYGITALLWLQGESNSVGAGTQDRRAYLQLTEKLQADFNREIVQGVAGQEEVPAVFTHQVSGIYMRDATEASIPMAQLDCAYALPNWFMVGPAYPVTEKGGHLDANGYRWLGQLFGKVMHRVLDLGEGWKPLHPVRATVRGAQVLVDFHVPHPPLVFAPCYVRTKATNYADGGFRVTDADGEVPVLAAAVVGEVSVLLVLERIPGETPALWYADQTRHGGYGNLRDSDPTEASQAYEYLEGRGQYPGSNLPELVGKPYPLWNWCVAFRTTLEQDCCSPSLPDLALRSLEAPQIGADMAVNSPPVAPIQDATSFDMQQAEIARAEAPSKTPSIAPAAEPNAIQAPYEQDSDTPLRGTVSEPPPPPPPHRRGFLALLRRLFGRG